MYKSHASYLNKAFADNLDEVIEKARKTLKFVEYDTMVGTGLSGALVIPTLARALGKYWAIVRKDDESHSSCSVEGQIGQRWIFVDDFVSLGGTRRRVKSAIARVMHNEDIFVGTLTYDPEGFVPEHL